MSPVALEIVTTACNVASFGVLAAAAAAAIVQLRHVRAGTRLQAVLAIERRFADPDVQRALFFVANDLAQRLQEPHYRAELIARGYVDPGAHPEMTALNWLNDAGMLIAGGFIDEAIFFDSFGRLVGYYWRLLAPAIALLRRERGSDQYAYVEYVAYRATRIVRQERAADTRLLRDAAPPADPWLAIDAELAARRTDGPA